MLKIDFINVGYGDSILLRSCEKGRQENVLIDAGDTDSSARYEKGRIHCVDFLHKRQIKKIHKLILTHLHKDHIGGLLRLAREIPVETVYTSYLPPEVSALPEDVSQYRGAASSLAEGFCLYEKAFRIFREHGCKEVLLPEGEHSFPLTQGVSGSYQLGWGGRLARQAEILNHFFSGDFGKGIEGELEELDTFINNMSVVISFSHEGIRFLLPGDACVSFWEEHAPPRCNVLKLPHHGHGDAMNEQLLRMLSPQVSVISVSNDRTDDCPQASLCRFLSASTFLFQTDPPPGTVPRESVSLCVLPGLLTARLREKGNKIVVKLEAKRL